MIADSAAGVKVSLQQELDGLLTKYHALHTSYLDLSDKHNQSLTKNNKLVLLVNQYRSAEGAMLARIAELEKFQRDATKYISNINTAHN